MLYASVVQPIRHSPHVANGILNVANGSIFGKLKISMFSEICTFSKKRFYPIIKI
jgi:hypothetical protein